MSRTYKKLEAQFHQILTNLCINAKDAITDNGKITIETTNISADEHYCTSNPDLRPGDYVLFTTKVDGCGMSEELLGKIIEPFFTTKKEGKRTGLGLATVDEIVKQNNGSLDVESEKEIGTTFRIFLPRLTNSS